MAGEVHEVEECPFKSDQKPLVVQCLKAGRDTALTSGSVLRNMNCVGEEKCPDMQTHRAVMEILRRLGEEEERLKELF